LTPAESGWDAGTPAAAIQSVWRTTKRHWQELRGTRAGRRFQAFYETHAAHRMGWARCLTFFAALVTFAIGVVLAFIPGPAVVFFALTAALLSTQSRWLARKLDRSELYVHALWRKHRRRRRARQQLRRLFVHPRSDGPR
jgi:uncharacterized membrane protein SirB2